MAFATTIFGSLNSHVYRIVLIVVYHLITRSFHLVLLLFFSCDSSVVRMCVCVCTCSRICNISKNHFVNTRNWHLHQFIVTNFGWSVLRFEFRRCKLKKLSICSMYFRLVIHAERRRKKVQVIAYCCTYIANIHAHPKQIVPLILASAYFIYYI